IRDPILYAVRSAGFAGGLPSRTVSSIAARLYQGPSLLSRAGSFGTRTPATKIIGNMGSTFSSPQISLNESEVRSESSGVLRSMYPKVHRPPCSRIILPPPPDHVEGPIR